VLLIGINRGGDFAAGLGSIDAANLVVAWPK
jgi:hypothetical protein